MTTLDIATSTPPDATPATTSLDKPAAPARPRLDPTQAHRVELPGGWADLRPISDVTERMRRPIKRLSARLTTYPQFMEAVKSAEEQKRTGDGNLTEAEKLAIAVSMGEAFDVLEELQDALVVAVTRGWSWEAPVTADGVLDLPGPALDALRQYAAPYQSALNPNFEPSPAADTPTGPSSG